MSEKVKYLSDQWRDAAEKKLKEMLPPDKMNKISSSMTNIYRNCPDGTERFFFVKYENGELAGIEVGEGEPPEAEFRITGDYDVFARITKAELGAQKALMTGKLKLKGNMVKALKLAAVVDRVNKVLSTIETEY